ncbi:MAG: VCBS repeat-containing protein, partial [Bryobacteraceae bacterium]
MNRRRFLGALAGAAYFRPAMARSAPFPVKFRKQLPYEPLYRFIEPGHDEFSGEKEAFEIAAHLKRLPATGKLPLAPEFQGISPFPVRYTQVAEGVQQAEYNQADTQFETGLAAWLRSLGNIRAARFFVLPEDAIRYEVASDLGRGAHYRVGVWKQKWSGGRLTHFAPVEETVVTSRPLFQDITSYSLAGSSAFEQQLRRGVPYWRARLDSACGIDVYGNNGIAVGDIDGDGWDEIYVCQPGGLPNRLFKNDGRGRFTDITEPAGVGVLDATASALFVDFRNTGRQDLIVLRGSGPLLFLNQGDGTFRLKADAFRFSSAPQGTFTGMAAADYDRDGRVDLYLCCYVYFQSEDQYQYPVPYYDARNGPPSFLFHNEGDGVFRDATAEAGLNADNHHFSFAAAWCDYDGDGWPDLYVANDFGRKSLYKNDRGKFRDIADAAGVKDTGPGMSAAWFDYDGDGRPDLYVSNMWTDAGQRVTREKDFSPNLAANDAYRRHAKGNSLFRNRGDGTFEETDSVEGVQMGRWAWSADGIDFDNDGAPEILIATGMLTNSSEKDLTSFFWRQV